MKACWKNEVDNKLSEKDVVRIFYLRANDSLPLRVIAARTGVSHEAVALILSRRRRGDVKIPSWIIRKVASMTKAPVSYKRIKKQQDAKTWISLGFTQQEVAEKMNVSQPTVSRWLSSNS